MFRTHIFIVGALLTMVGCGTKDQKDGGLSPDSSLMDASAVMNDSGVDQGGASGDAVAAGPDSGVSTVLGYRTESLSYRPLGRDTDRTVPVALWYAAREPTETTALYKVFPRDDVFVNAPPALSEPAPVLLFSHGRRGFGEYSYFLCEFFARRGWLVAAVDHVGDRLADGETPPDIYSLRPQDISALIDHITQLPMDHPLTGLASDKIALAGHSFGGYTTLVNAGAAYDVPTLQMDCATGWDSDFCRNLGTDAMYFEAGFRDSRIKVAFPLAPGNTRLFGAGLGDIDIPVMLMTGARDRSLADEAHGAPIWAGLVGETHRRVQFHSGGHFTFTNVCLFAGPLGEDNGCDESFILPEEAHPIINAYALAFARRHLFNDESGADLIDGVSPLHDDVELMRK